MIIKCLGGCREVGRNGFLLQVKENNQKENIMLDYGLKVETGETPIPAQDVDSILLSHQHLDHCGSTPTLFRENSKAKIYATPPCFDHTHMLLKDSMKIARLKGRAPLFTQYEVNKLKENQIKIKIGEKFSTPASNVEVLSAGHIPGSVMFIINTEGKRILFTGDYNLQDTRLMKGADISKIKDIDVLIMESTYSSREHSPRKATEEKLLKIVKETIDNGGIALIPAFAVGRSAEVITILDKLAKKVPIFLDGMARTATKITANHPEFLRDNALEKATENITFIKNQHERQQAMDQPSAIVTTGGCLDGGPIVHYIKHLYTREDCSMSFTGFMIPRTTGRYLQDTGRFVNEDMDLKIKMPINFLDFSGHAGRSDLMKTVQTIRPKKVICIHGDHCQRFATELKGRFEVEAIAPVPGQIIKV
jgi:putative mRNA 3-end processing factor